MPKQGNASLLLAECEKSSKIGSKYTQTYCEGSGAFASTDVICQLRHVQRLVQSQSHSDMQRFPKKAPVVCSVWSVLTLQQINAVLVNGVNKARICLGRKTMKGIKWRCVQYTRVVQRATKPR